MSYLIGCLVKCIICQIHKNCNKNRPCGSRNHTRATFWKILS
nr:MAG TPA: hypothetical protein [Caudoviricetes sp.]